jgi:FkbM family methyltransferase
MIDSILRTLPGFKGKRRLARMLMSGKISTASDVVIQGRDGFVFMLPNIQENIGFEIFVNGVYEEDTIRFIKATARKGRVFLDIGANIGAIAIPVSASLEDIETICIEASPRMFRYLEHNVQKNNLKNVRLINCAIAETAGKKVPFYSPELKFGKGSLGPSFTSESSMVETVTLDDLAESVGWERIGLIKIDIEGFESFAFKGGEKLLKRKDAPDILFEFVDWAERLAPGATPGGAQKVLLDFGYNIYRLQGSSVGQRVVAPMQTGSCELFASKTLH